MFVYNLLMDAESTNKPKVRKRKAALNVSFCVKKERTTLYQKVSMILQKSAAERSKDETEFLDNSKEVAHQITQRKAQRQKLKDRAQEYEDPAEILSGKCKTLAEAVINSNHLVVYTGAGISTAACIPDYRGSNGIWTLLQQGKDIGLHDLSQAEPTLTHMALYCLYRSGILKHIVSQNCDGLHLRSGIPRSALSEVHGNMYLEVCTSCKPCNHYLRLFDVTEYTARYSHETLRLCYKCGKPLKDTIVHFGERGKLDWPLNWKTACAQADKADVILCLGSSLKVLKKYSWLWSMDRPVKKRPKLYIVNLQWTPKDDHSTLKINGKCDTVIAQMMSYLGLAIPQYVRSMDPIFFHATILHEAEVHTTSRKPIRRDLTFTEDEDSNPICEADKEENGRDNKGTNVMCSSSTDVDVNMKPEITSDNDQHSNDLTSSDTLLLEHSKLGQEIIIDANSDKENDVVSTADGFKPLKKTSRDTDVEIKIGKILNVDEAEMSNIVSAVIEEAVHVKLEIKTESQSQEEEAEAKLNSASNACLAVEPYIESSLSVLCSRSLWSDLSLFDTLTHQPILLGPSILGWSDMNSSLVRYQSKKQCSPVEDSPEDAKLSNLKSACSFCYGYYNSQRCLFYASYPPNLPIETNAACLCCDGDDDEDEQPEQEEDDDKTTSKVPNINPGWFGKGYRKKIKKRR